MARYGELHAHSGFSFLDGASDPEELCVEASRLGLSALALTDHHGLYGAVRFAEAARSLGLPTIFGSEITVQGGGTRTGVPDPEGEHLVVLARNPEGYRRLSVMLARAHLALGEKGAPTFSLEEMARHASEWVVLTGCRKGPVTSALYREGPRAATRRLDYLRELFGESLVVELWDHGSSDDVVRNDFLAEAATQRQMMMVATANAHYATPRDLHRSHVLSAIRANHTLDEMTGWMQPGPTASLRSEAEQRRRFARWPGVVDAAGELAQAVAFDLSLVTPELPNFPAPRGLNEQQYLEELVNEGAERRYGPRHAERVPGAWKQIDHELAVINELGFAGYFLIVWDITEFARRSNIYCQGRGSAANSAVCYALGITNADAVRLNLFFERFLSTARDGPPDIDVDFESARREEVIQYVYERYGRHHAAQVAAVITYRPRSAQRDVARVFGYLDPLAVPDELVPIVDEQAQALLGRPRHLGIHSAGMVICDRPVIEVCPVEWGRTPGRSVLQWDKDDCAAAGLVKFDLLGLGMLEALHRCVDLIAESEGVAIDLGDLPQEDAVYDMLCEADSVGLFQVESRAQMATLPRVQPRCFYDLVIEVALIRPGPIQGQSVNPYIRRRRGEEPVTYLHPLLEPILRRTLGVPLFQEQLMEMAVAVGGFSPSEADELRQAMAAKRSEIRMARLKGRFYAGMAERGIEGENADYLWDALSAFANFGFPESHSVSFAHLVYCSAWLKLHYPAAFLASLLNAQPLGFWSPQSLVADAQRHGVTVERVCVNRSDVDARLERSPEGELRVRLGLSHVRGVGRASAQRIVAGAPWRTLTDLVRDADLRESETEALATAGAFDVLSASRRGALWQAGAVARARGGLPGLETGTQAPRLNEATPLEQIADDTWATGITLEGSIMELLRPVLDARGVTRSDALAGAETYRVSVAGVVTHRQHPETARGAVFINLEDEAGHVNVIFSKGAWLRFAGVAAHAPVLLVRGTLQRGQGSVAISAEYVEALEVGVPTTPSRDFR